jgi:hypothetical protein
MDPQEVLAELQATVAHMRGEITFLRDQFATATAAATASASISRPKPSLPHPDKFAGDARKYDTWLASIKAKLAVDGEAIGNNVAQFNYVYLNLESNTQSIVLPQLEALPHELDYNTILTSLSRIYANPHKIREAKDRLNRLTQGSDSLSMYVAKYERLVGEARVGHYPDDAKIEAFRRGLSRTTLEKITNKGEEPTEINTYIAYIQRIVSSHASVPYTPASASHSHPHPPSTPRRFDNNHHSSYSPARKPSTAHYAGGEPMDVSSLEVTHDDDDAATVRG